MRKNIHCVLVTKYNIKKPNRLSTKKKLLKLNNSMKLEILWSNHTWKKIVAKQNKFKIKFDRKNTIVSFQCISASMHYTRFCIKIFIKYIYAVVIGYVEKGKT